MVIQWPGNFPVMEVAMIKLVSQGLMSSDEQTSVMSSDEQIINETAWFANSWFSGNLIGP